MGGEGACDPLYDCPKCTWKSNGSVNGTHTPTVATVDKYIEANQAARNDSL